jgi:hypothetical protein
MLAHAQKSISSKQSKTVLSFTHNIVRGGRGIEETLDNNKDTGNKTRRSNSGGQKVRLSKR